MLSAPLPYPFPNVCATVAYSGAPPRQEPAAVGRPRVFSSSLGAMRVKVTSKAARRGDDSDADDDDDDDDSFESKMKVITVGVAW